MNDSKNVEGEPQTRVSVLNISGGVWRTTSVSATPQLVLTDWRVFSVPLPGGGGASRHFVGWNVTEREGRVSSPIVDFDPKTMRGRTQTGRVYELRGQAGWNSDADYVLNVWKRRNGVTNSLELMDISNEIAKIDGAQ